MDDHSGCRQACQTHLLAGALWQRGDCQNREDEDEEPRRKVSHRWVKHGVDEVAEGRADLIQIVHQFAPCKSGQQLMARIVDPTKDLLSLTFTGDQSILN